MLEQSWIWAFCACTLSAVTPETGGPIPQAHYQAAPAEGMSLSIIERPTSEDSVGAAKNTALFSLWPPPMYTHAHVSLPQVYTHRHAHRRQDKVWTDVVPFLTEVRKVL